MSRIDPTVKKETGYIAGWVLLLSAVMELVFLLTGHMDYTVPLGNLLGGVAAILNFFLMGWTIQRAVGLDEKAAAAKLKLSQLLRMLMLIVHLLPGHRAELLPDGSGDRAPVLPPYRSGVPSAV